MNFGNKLLTVLFLVAFLPIGGLHAENKPNLSMNFELNSPYPDQGPEVNTLRSELFFVKNNASAWARLSPLYQTFYQQRTADSVKVQPDKPEMKYHLWLQDEPADIVVIIPGTGESFVDLTPTAFAELYYKQGYSTVIISSAFNWEFMQSAASVLTPGYTPFDAKDVQNAIEKMLAKINKENPGKLKRKVLLGTSLGALHTLFIAGEYRRHNNDYFDRYIAVNPPVDLLYAMKKLDKFYAVGATWKKDQIQPKVRQCIIAYMRMLRGISPDAAPIAGGINRRQAIKMSVDKKRKNGEIDFDPEDAKFLIGLSFHMNLMEVIYSIYSRHDTGVIKAQPDWFDRRDIYAEIDKFNFNSYLHKFLLPECEKLLGKKLTPDTLNETAGLHAIAKTLKIDNRIRIIHNSDDILLQEGDLLWLYQRVGKRMTIFKHGGHLGNLYTEPVQKALIKCAAE